MIYTLSPIGGGKSSLTKILTDQLGSSAYYEDVTDGIIAPILNKFYSNGSQSQQQYGLALQLAFLTKRFSQLKVAMEEKNAVLDSSLLSDHIMCSNIHANGDMSDEEYNIYEVLNQEMQTEVNGKPWSGYPQLIIYIKISPEKEVEEISKRGRGMEMSPDLVEYYHSVNKAYEDWYTGYVGSPTIMIDRDKYDYVNNLEDRKSVLQMIYQRMRELGMLDKDEFEALVKKLEELKLTSISSDGIEVDA